MNLNKIHTCLFLEKSESYSDSLLLFSKSMEKKGVKLLQYKQKAAIQPPLNAGKQLELTIPIIGLVVCYNIYKNQRIRRHAAMKDWNFGYFGKGIDGYVHYTQAFNRNFPQSSRQPEAKQKPHNVTPKEEGSLLQCLAELGGLFIIIVILLGVLSLLQ